MQQVILASVDPKTRVTNAAGLLRFTQYCDEFGISELDRMPASDALLAAFVSSGAAKVGSAQHWVDGLHLWHDVHGAPWHGGDLLRRALTGVRKLAPPSSHRPPRPPVTYEHLQALLVRLDFSNTKDCAVWAAASVAFWSCCRLGELLIPSRGTFDSHKHASRSADLHRGETRDGDPFFTLHIPFSKTTGNAGADIAIVHSSDATSPFTALEYHLRVNHDLPESAPFFAFRQGDSWEPLTKPAFLNRCNEIWGVAGLTMISGGHSFRIGGVTELLLRGVPPEVVAKQGRWRSDAFLKYWRRIETIVPLLISQALFSFEVTRISNVMESFRLRLGLSK
ncbi:DNA breaking-rejoining enzyme [Stereum hirsutum FP-91666 SS1]|uniref:DNA breaking-rejoining enzyme n=1 Tax=Stereum hirsutum (strain FP-91666) TaxID=721885 RepID=UPI000444924A|nr:DNA breaking-rejoining enzyme [Stereum hirsutum FP-91666 SS1]EIM85176.1 DNA breaking-rejoining enzyme [Stereum hirsutum FP-91666 SS1]